LELELQKQARLKVHEEGFSYERKAQDLKNLVCPLEASPKKSVLSQDFRQKRMEQLKEDLREVDIQLTYAAKQCEKCANAKEFSKALDVSKELNQLRKKKRKTRS